MLSSEIINTYYRRMIEEKMKNSGECQPSLIQQDLQFLNTTRSKALKILKSRVFTKSTVSGYSSDLLKNTHEYRIINNSGMGDVLGMNKTTQISYNSSPEYSSPLLFKTADEKQYISKQVIITSVSTGAQTLSSELFEAGTQTLFNYTEAASQTNTEMTPGVSPSTFMASIQTSSPTDSKTTALADTTRLTVQGIDDRDPTDKRQQSKFSAKKMIRDFERFKETLADIHESLKTSIELLKQEVDSFSNASSSEYASSSSPNEFTSPSEQYYSVENEPLSSAQDTRSSEQFFLALVTNEHSMSMHNTDSQEQRTSSCEHDMDISEHEIILSEEAVVHGEDDNSSKYVTARNEHGTSELHGIPERISPCEHNMDVSENEIVLSEEVVVHVQDTNPSIPERISPCEHNMDVSENEIILSEEVVVHVQDTNPSIPERISPCEHNMDVSENEIILSEEVVVHVQDTNPSIPERISPCEYNMDVSEQAIVHVQYTNSSKNDTTPNEHGASEQHGIPERISPCEHNMNVSEHEIVLSEEAVVHVQNTNSSIQERISPCEHNVGISEHKIILSEQSIVHVQDTNSSKCDTTHNKHVTSEQHDVPEQEFDIRNMVTWNSFGDKVFDYSTMLSMYGFDPQKSPFVHCGYPRIDNLPEDLDGLKLQGIKKRDVKYQKYENGLYKVIGRGTYGEVYLAKMKKIQNKVVVKEFHNPGVRWADVELEAKILTYLQGQDITPNFLGVLVPRKKSRSYSYSLVQEYYGHGTVENVYLNHELSPYAWIRICRNICRVLFKIHSNHIVFNDVKPDNILVNLDNFDIRFIDFGMATFRQGIFFNNSKILQNCLFYGPEVREECFSTPQSDIYSLGFLFKQIIKYGNIDHLYPLYKACTSVKAIDRPSLPEIMEILDTM